MTALFSILTAAAIWFSPATPYQIGDKVDNFTLLNTIDDKQVALTDYADQEGVIVIFTCNHCPYAKLYEERIMELDQKMAAKGYPVVAISPNDPVKEPDDAPENMKVRAIEKGYTFPYLFDATQEVAKAFGATRTPHVFLLNNRGGAFYLSYIGAIDDNTNDPDAVTVRFVEDAVMALKAGIQPNPPVTKAIGCTIKWKDS